MKLLEVSELARVHVYRGRIHMGASFKKLSQLIEEEMKQKPASGHLYLFLNKKGSYTKILFSSKGGECIFAKRLDPGGRFNLDSEKVKVISVETMQKIINQVVDTKKVTKPLRLGKAA